jgi:DTW domain-containing protein YfiP
MTFRAVCHRCWKPEVTCICARLPRVDNRTPVLVLQHPRERLHPIGTARFAQLGLERARIEIAWGAGEVEDVAPAWLPRDAGLLYPSPHARLLDDVPERERPAQLLVLDGTWHTAKTLYRDKRWLHALPHFRLLPSAPGRYRIRREPQHDYVSTIEAIAGALAILEPEITGLPALLAAFDSMIDDQIRFAQARSGERRTRTKRRPRAELRVPHALVSGFERLIIVYGESARPRGGEAREFCYFGAHAVATGADFLCAVEPSTGLPDAEHLDHMQLTAADFAGACSPDEFRARWQQFVSAAGPRPLFAAWNQRTLDLLALATGDALSRLSLKGAYRAVHGSAELGIAQVIARRELSLPATPASGRARERLGGAIAVARFLHDGALQPSAAQ